MKLEIILSQRQQQLEELIIVDQEDFSQFQILILQSVLLSTNLADNQEAYKVHIFWILARIFRYKLDIYFIPKPRIKSIWLSFCSFILDLESKKNIHIEMLDQILAYLDQQIATFFTVNHA